MIFRAQVFFDLADFFQKDSKTRWTFPRDHRSKVDDHSFERKSSKCSSNGSFRRKKFGKITETFMNHPDRVPFELGTSEEGGGRNGSGSFTWVGGRASDKRGPNCQMWSNYSSTLEETVAGRAFSLTIWRVHRHSSMAMEKLTLRPVITSPGPVGSWPAFFLFFYYYCYYYLYHSRNGEPTPPVYQWAFPIRNEEGFAFLLLPSFLSFSFPSFLFHLRRLPS